MKDQQIWGHSCSHSSSPRHLKGKKEMGKHKHIIKPRSQLTRPIPAIPKSHLAARRIITCCRFKTSRCCQLFMIAVIYTVPLVCLALGSHVQMRANLSPEKIPNEIRLNTAADVNTQHMGMRGKREVQIHKDRAISRH